MTTESPLPICPTSISGFTSRIPVFGWIHPQDGPGSPLKQVWVFLLILHRRDHCLPAHPGISAPITHSLRSRLGAGMFRSQYGIGRYTHTRVPSLAVGVNYH
jgi:hypothetical protein